MRYEVPQFIEIEDKIFGPLTWRQFLYLSGGLGTSVMIFLKLGVVTFILIGLPLAILAGALSFYPVNNRPFSFFLEAIFNYLRSQRLYLWKKRENIIHKQYTPVEERKKTNQAGLTNKPKKRGGIASMSRKLELKALQKNE